MMIAFLLSCIHTNTLLIGRKGKWYMEKSMRGEGLSLVKYCTLKEGYISSCLHDALCCHQQWERFLAAFVFVVPDALFLFSDDSQLRWHVLWLWIMEILLWVYLSIQSKSGQQGAFSVFFLVYVLAYALHWTNQNLRMLQYQISLPNVTVVVMLLLHLMFFLAGCFVVLMMMMKQATW